MTGSIDTTKTTIPVGIGEASSVELLVMLPPERPPVLKRLDRRGKLKRSRHVRRHRHRARRARPVAQKPSPFAFLGNWQTNTRTPQPVKPRTRKRR